MTKHYEREYRIRGKGIGKEKARSTEAVIVSNWTFECRPFRCFNQQNKFLVDG